MEVDQFPNRAGLGDKPRHCVQIAAISIAERPCLPRFPCVSQNRYRPRFSPRILREQNSKGSASTDRCHAVRNAQLRFSATIYYEIGCESIAVLETRPRRGIAFRRDCRLIDPASIVNFFSNFLQSDNSQPDHNLWGMARDSTPRVVFHRLDNLYRRFIVAPGSNAPLVADANPANTTSSVAIRQILAESDNIR